MNYTIFKPNSKNKGAIVNFRVSKTKNERKDIWENRLFVESIPQKTWDNEKKRGTFDPEKKKVVVIEPTEAGDIIHSILEKVPFESYHKRQEGGTWIKFGPFNGTRKFKDKDGNETEYKIKRFGFSVSEKGLHISAPIEPQEAQCLRVLLENYIKEAMGLEGSELKKKFTKNKNSSDSEEEESEESNSNDNDVEDEENDDIPF